MKRRQFLSVTGATTALAGWSQSIGLQANATAAEAKRPVRMYVGTQRGPTTVERLQYFKRHGVDHICGYPPNPGQRGYWTVEELETILPGTVLARDTKAPHIP